MSLRSVSTKFSFPSVPKSSKINNQKNHFTQNFSFSSLKTTGGPLRKIIDGQLYLFSFKGPIKKKESFIYKKFSTENYLLKSHPQTQVWKDRIISENYEIDFSHPNYAHLNIQKEIVFISYALKELSSQIKMICMSGESPPEWIHCVTNIILLRQIPYIPRLYIIDKKFPDMDREPPDLGEVYDFHKQPFNLSNFEILKDRIQEDIHFLEITGFPLLPESIQWLIEFLKTFPYLGIVFSFSEPLEF